MTKDLFIRFIPVIGVFALAAIASKVLRPYWAAWMTMPSSRLETLLTSGAMSLGVVTLVMALLLLIGAPHQVILIFSVFAFLMGYLCSLIMLNVSAGTYFSRRNILQKMAAANQYAILAIWKEPMVVKRLAVAPRPAVLLPCGFRMTLAPMKSISTFSRRGGGVSLSTIGVLLTTHQLGYGRLGVRALEPDWRAIDMGGTKVFFDNYVNPVSRVPPDWEALGRALIHYCPDFFQRYSLMATEGLIVIGNRVEPESKEDYVRFANDLARIHRALADHGI